MIDQRIEGGGPILHTVNDTSNLVGAISMSNKVVDDEVEAIPVELLHGGEHFDDDPAQTFRKASRRRAKKRSGSITLPREKIHENIVEMDIRRPTIRR